MAFNAGNAFITVSPDMSKFQSDVKAKIADTPDATILATADTSKLTAELDEATAGRTAEVTADADTTEAAAVLDSLAADRKVTVEADADTAAAETQLETLTKTRTAKVKVSIDKDALKELAVPALAIGGAVSLGPSAVAAALAIGGIGAAFASAGADAGAFGVIAKGMFSDVTTAQKALTKAQADYAKADTSKERAAALQAEADAVKNLTPAEAALLTELNALEAAWKKLSQSEQPAVGAAIAPWLQTATDGMRLLAPLITDASNAIELLGNEADTAIKSPFWTTFSTTLGTTGEEALQVFGTAVGSVADGLAHLFVTFAPDIQNVLPLVDKAATAFDDWAKSVTSTGLDNFFKTTFSPANVAALKTDLGDVATIVENIAKAGANLAPTAFSGLSNLLAVAAKLSPGQIEALAGLYAGTKAVGGIGNAASLLTGGAAISLPGKGKKKVKAATPAAGEEEEPGASKAGKVAGAAASAVPVLGAASVLDQAIPKGPGGEWVNSWAPYEKIFTNDLPHGYSIAYEAFQVEFAGPMTAWFTESLPHFFTAQIPMGWDAAYQNFENGFGSPVAAWFTNSLPHFFTSAVPGAWSWAYQGFETEIGSPVAAWFDTSLPHFFTSAVPAAWSWAYQGFMTEVGTPVANWFTNSVPHFFTSAVPAAWSWAYTGFMSAVGTPVANWFSSSVPHFFTSAVPAAWSWAYTGFMSAVGTPVANWFSSSVPHFFTSAVPSAWSWAYTGFTSTVGTPVSNWFSSSLPSFVTRSIPGAFSSLWSSFSSAVVSPIESFFTSTLPSLASSAASTAKSTVSSILGSAASALGFASGTDDAPPGWAWVGEHGPELLHFSGGEQVLPHAASLAKAQSLSALSSLGVPSVAGPGRLPGVNAPLQAGAVQPVLQVAPGDSSGLDALFLDWLAEKSRRGQITLKAS